MARSVRRSIDRVWVLTFALLMVIAFQNCTGSRDVDFSSFVKKVATLESGGGDGQTFDGKPVPGTYVRRYAEFACNGEAAPLSIIEVTVTTAVLVRDDCNEYSQLISFSDPNLSFGGHNPGVIAFKGGIFEKEDEVSDFEGFIPEILCRAGDAASGLDVVIRSQQGELAAQIQFGQLDSALGEWLNRTVPLFAVNEGSEGSLVQYSDGQGLFDLSIDTSKILGDDLFEGSFQATIDGDQQDRLMSCRLTNDEPLLNLSLEGLVALWRFDGELETAVLDSSGNGHTLSLEDGGDGSPGIVSGVFGEALDLDGFDDVLTVAPAPSLNVGAEITMSGWIRAETLPEGFPTASDPRIMQKGVSSTSSMYRFGLRTSDGNPRFTGEVLVSGIRHVVEGGAVAPNEWYHVALVRVGNRLSLYANGNLISERTDLSLSDIRANEEPLFLCASPGNSNGSCDGTIDEVSLWNRGLSSEEVHVIFSEGINLL